MDRPHVIVVDDVDIFREAVSGYLSRNGVRVTQARTGSELRDLCRTADFDIVILDLGLPDETGLDLVRHLRTTRRCGIIVLTANDDPTDAVVGFELGADAYLVKPHSNRELLARVRSITRRLSEAPGASRHRAAAPMPGIGGWKLEPRRRRLVGPDGGELALTRSEALLVTELSKAGGQAVDRDALSRAVFHRAWEYEDRSLDILVARFRKKLTAAGLEEGIRSVRGTGYMLGDFHSEVRTDTASQPGREHGEPTAPRP